MLRVPGRLIIFALVLGLLSGTLLGWLGLVWAGVNIVLFSFIAIIDQDESSLGVISYAARGNRTKRTERRSIVSLVYYSIQQVYSSGVDDSGMWIFILVMSALPAGVVGLVFGLSISVWAGLVIGIGEAVSILAFIVSVDPTFVLADELSSNERRRYTREVPSPGL